MASRSEQARQDQATQQRRDAACASLIEATYRHGVEPFAESRHVAADVLSALIEAIAGEQVDAQTLRRKGWQGNSKGMDEALHHVRYWRDLLVAYTPPAPIEGPKVTATTDAQGIPVSARAGSVAELDARLVDAFGPMLAPTRHIRTVLETSVPHPMDSFGNPTYGALCNATTGSWTHRGGANCETCIATYDAEHGPYTGPVAYGNTERRDEPVTPAVAAAIRAEVEAEQATILGVPVVTDPRMPDDTVAVISPEDAAVFKVGDTVTVGGIEFTKHSEWPFGTGGNILNPDNEQGVSLAMDASAHERINALPDATVTTSGTFDDGRLIHEGDAVSVELPDGRTIYKAQNVITSGMSTIADLAAPPFVDPTPTTRPRMTLAQVREHGIARRRGADHRSVSQIEGISDCGTRYALSDLERPAWWNVGGKALHRAVETINYRVAAEQLDGFTGDGQGTLETVFEPLFLGCLDAEIADQHAATPQFPMDTWRASKKGSEHYDFWRVEGPVMVQRWVSWLSGMLADGWTIATARRADIGEETPIIEYRCELNVGLEVPDLSIIDLALYRASHNELLVPDIKAGASAPKSTFQLGVYGWALLAAGIAGFTPAPDLSNVRGTYWRARTGEHTPVAPVLQQNPWPYVVQRFRDGDTLDRAGIYTPNVTSFCGGCGVRDLCPAQAS